MVGGKSFGFFGILITILCKRWFHYMLFLFSYSFFSLFAMIFRGKSVLLFSVITVIFMRFTEKQVTI